MKTRLLLLVVCVAVIASLPLYGAMIKRTDAIWARNASGPITVDGKLNEADWATAESLHIVMGQNNGWPGSGWWWQSGAKPGTDLTDAIVKFLVRGDSLYVGWIIKDKSIGALPNWAQFDQLLTNMRYPQPTGVSGTPGRAGNTQQNFEITYGYYCGSDWGDTLAGKVGGTPGFMGFAGSQNMWPRPDSLKAIWNAVTTVRGTSNDDATPDTSWTTEFVINLAYFGYHPQQSGGDIAMYSFSIWDFDYAWPVDSVKNSSTTVWEQAVWANASPYSHLRVYMRPDVTSSSGTVPVVGPDWTIPSATNYAAPTIDGKLDEPVWQAAPSIQMKYGDGNIRANYPGTMKWRSGQTQFTVNGSTNPVIDPNLTNVKYFVKGDTLYLGFDVKDKFVQYVKLPDGSYDGNRSDGFDVIFNDRGMLDGDSIFARHDFAFIVDSAGATKRLNDLALGGWDSVGCVRVKIALNSGTVVDTVGSVADSGYTAEMAIDLTKLGYPHGLGDGVAWFSIIAWDGDSFNGGSYGTKTWIGRPGGWDDGPAWFYIDPSVVLVSVDNKGANAFPTQFALLGNYPNPFNPSTSIRFQVPQQSEITLDVYDVIGRLVSSKSLGVRQPGEQAVSFDASALATGTYVYRLKMASTGATLVGKMMLLK